MKQISSWINGLSPTESQFKILLQSDHYDNRVKLTPSQSSHKLRFAATVEEIADIAKTQNRAMIVDGKPLCVYTARIESFFS